MCVPILFRNVFFDNRISSFFSNINLINQINNKQNVTEKGIKLSTIFRKILRKCHFAKWNIFFYYSIRNLQFSYKYQHKRSTVRTSNSEISNQ